MKPSRLVNHEYSVSLTLEQMAHQTCIPISEIGSAIKELKDRNLVTVVRLPLSKPRYIINFEEIQRQGMRND